MLAFMKAPAKPWIHLLLCLLLLGTQGVVLGGPHQSPAPQQQSDAMDHHEADCPQGLYCAGESGDNTFCDQLCQLISSVGPTTEPQPPFSTPLDVELPSATIKDRLSDYLPPVEHGPPRPRV